MAARSVIVGGGRQIGKAGKPRRDGQLAVQTRYHRLGQAAGRRHLCQACLCFIGAMGKGGDQPVDRLGRDQNG